MLLRHSAIYLFSRGVPGLIGLVTIITYTRLLSPDSYGRYSLILTGSVMANAILYQWLNSSLLRFLPEYRKQEKVLLLAILNGFFLMSLLVGFAGLSVALLSGDKEWSNVIILGVLLIWAEAWFTINLQISRSQLAPIQYGIASMVKATAALGLGVVLVLGGFGASGAVTGLLVGFSIAALWMSRNRWTGLKSFRFDKELVAKLLRYGLPLSASFGLAVVIASTDRFMLAGLIDEAATGVYSASQGLAQQAVGAAMMIVNLAAYPIILRTLEHDGVESTRAQLRKNAILLLGIGLPVTSAFIVLPGDIAKFFLGQPFQAAGTALMPWLAVATFLASLRAYYLDLPFYLGKSTRIQVAVMAVAATLNIILNLWLIPVFGYMGAVYASVAAHSIAVVFSAVIGRRVFRLPSLTGDAIRLLLATIFAAATLYFVPDGGSKILFVVRVAAATIVYIFGLIAFGVPGVKQVVFRICKHASGKLNIVSR